METGIDFFQQMKREGKGRKPKLNPDRIRAIRKKMREGVPQQVIAEQEGIAKSTVSAISTKQIWGHIPEEEPAQ
jgi:DNA invertase Pin-like site-specific DNA recombinase